MDLQLDDFRLTFEENKKTVRKLSDMKDFYADQRMATRTLQLYDPTIYAVYAHESEGPGNLSYAVTVINPGDIGGEYYMTKGHFHTKPTAELYLGLEGEGILLLQDRKGKAKKLPLQPGKISYVPKDHAHRAINTGDSQLKFLAIYSSDSGHDYSTIKEKGFEERVKKK